MANRYASIPPEERLWKRVRKTESCWLWEGVRDGGGYGRFSLDNKQVFVHRFSYELHYGPIPTGLLVCHKCDVRNCVRPDHLYVGTQSDNMQDAIRKGRHKPPTGIHPDIFTRKRMSEAQKNRFKLNPMSEEVRRKIGEARRQKGKDRK